ncbi:MAG TPA: hypothetical protein VH415_01405 [Nitrososphaeraceae archaeon]|jgi:hypothetical protein
MRQNNERKWKPLTISLPEDLLNKIDDLRNDVTRSKYVQRVLLQHVRFVESAVEIR